MIHRPFAESAIYGGFANYAAWQARAAEARRLAVADRSNGIAHEFDSGIWRDLKDSLLNYFAGKCAYCEINVRAGFWGDVEHYRPKKKVEGEPTHPGYYWLAYEPSNLMPSCQRCNQGGAKMNHFPIEGPRATKPEEIDAEQPLLLNPYVDKPSDHLQYEYDPTNDKPTGFLHHKTERGRTSIEIYRLNRDSLPDERLAAQKASIDSFKAARNEREVPGFMAELSSGKLAYTGARLSAVRSYWGWESAMIDSEVLRG